MSLVYHKHTLKILLSMFGPGNKIAEDKIVTGIEFHKMV